MERPQFTIRDLLLAVTLIGAGLGWLLTAPPPYNFVVGAAIAGAGIGAIFHAKIVGGLVGFILGGILFSVALRFSDL